MPGLDWKQELTNRAHKGDRPMMQASKKFFILASFITIASVADVAACSMSVDDNYQKNLLVAHAASFNSLALTGVKSTAVETYAKTFEGGSGSGCPDYLVAEARISFEYAPKKNHECSAAVTVRSRIYIGNDLPDGQFEDIQFISPEKACSTHSGPVLRIPRRIIIR